MPSLYVGNNRDEIPTYFRQICTSDGTMARITVGEDAGDGGDSYEYATTGRTLTLPRIDLLTAYLIRAPDFSLVTLPRSL